MYNTFLSRKNLFFYKIGILILKKKRKKYQIDVTNLTKKIINLASGRWWLRGIHSF